MRYTPKHRAARSHSRLRRVGLALAGGATIAAGTLATADAASAAPSNVWDRVAACESGGNWKISTGNGFHGGLQFTKSSWRAAGGTKYASMPHHATRAQQIAAAQNLLRQQGPGAWPVCSKKAGLNRSNGMGSGGGAVTATRSAGLKASSNRSHGLSKSTVRAIQRHVGASVDGVVGPETVRKTERALGLKKSGKSYFSAATLRKALRLV